MRQTVGTTTLFQYVLTFTIIFACFLALAITYNRVYKVKNEILTIIEKYEGVVSNGTALSIINNYLYNNGYNTKSTCSTGEYGVENLSNPTYELAQSNKSYYYCLSSKKVTDGSTDKVYYDIKLFFKFNLPVVGELFVFRITGQTKGIFLYDEDAQLLG